MASRGFSLGLILIVAATIITSSQLNFIAASSLPLDAQAQLQPAPPLQPAETSPIKPNAVIKFIGVKHGFGELQQARSAFEQKVQLVIGQPLTIDLFDPMTNDGTRGTGLIEWHSLDMNDCNEDRIRQLLAKFKNPAANGWTREFKMEFGPDFDMPEQIAFEWRNECAANYQKRTLEAASSTTTTTTTTGAPATTPTPEPVTNPPEAPSTTTEAPMTTPEPPVTMSEGLNMTSADTSEDAANSSETPTTTSSETTTSEFSMISFTDFNSTLFPITPTTTTTEAAATTTTSFAEVGSTSRETSTSETRATSSETPTTTIAAAATTTTPTTSSEVPSTTLKAPTSTEEIFIKAFEDLSATSPEESENDSLVDSASSTAIPLAEETPALNSSGASSSPHYGKYIGLTTGFFVFIAYLLCARAYRRQGMYELHEST